MSDSSQHLHLNPLCMLSTIQLKAGMRLSLFLLAIRPELGSVIDSQQLHQSPHYFGLSIKDIEVYKSIPFLWYCDIMFFPPCD